MMPSNSRQSVSVFFLFFLFSPSLVLCQMPVTEGCSAEGNKSYHIFLHIIRIFLFLLTLYVERCFGSNILALFIVNKSYYTYHPSLSCKYWSSDVDM